MPEEGGKGGSGNSAIAREEPPETLRDFLSAAEEAVHRHPVRWPAFVVRLVLITPGALGFLRAVCPWQSVVLIQLLS